MEISKEGLDLIMEFEVGGSDGNYYNKCLKHPTVPAWQTTASGVTWGIGFDGGQNSPQDIQKYWNGFLDDSVIERLMKTSGLKGRTAHDYLPKVQDITVDWENAKNQFNHFTVPRFFTLSQKTYPNFTESPKCVQEALVSLTFNRGTRLQGSSRVEMKTISDLMAQRNYKAIPEQLRKMKRLWPNVKGLVRRREAEAKFIENGLGS